MALSLLVAALVLAVLAAAYRYLYRRLVRDVSVAGGRWRRVGTVVVLLLAVGTALLLTVGPLEPPVPVRRLAAGWAGWWLPVLLYLVLALLLGELVRPLLRRTLARRAARPPHRTDDADDPADASRRLFVARTVAVGASVVAVGGAVAGRSAPASGQDPAAGGVELSLPFTGLWLARNSPARQVPSHGTDLLGGRYAIDFVAVDAAHRTSDRHDWRSLLTSEPPERFHAFGRPILAPAAGTVVAAHDGEPDHEARRSQPALVPYTLGQSARLRRGVGAVAGNHVVIALPGGAFVGLAHFRSGSLRVRVGARVVEGQHLADCGNSGNSTQPHVHVQAMDSADLTVARGVPMLFRRFREWPTGPGTGRVREWTVPGEEAVVQPLPSPPVGG
ncbi:M23 family metallopeptidase [Micromonospora mirobrigensis]|uniref:Peptidase family M23 n=1 Tax=Micromonospora mirobrigensis TaxID=262898 RepID=A0A1C4YW89_9ACTN|nr:M23 family metallopeptidase [Micromonospora mirobrigensis]SCF24944.1 Peptidase family M23 [Micromonospora mirobrigensis]